LVKDTNIPDIHSVTIFSTYNTIMVIEKLSKCQVDGQVDFSKNYLMFQYKQGFSPSLNIKKEIHQHDNVHKSIRNLSMEQ